MGIKNKTLLRVSVVVIFFIGLFSIAFSIIFSNKLTGESVGNSENMLENMNHNLTSYFDEVSAIANEPNFDYYLQNYMIEEKMDEQQYDSISTNKVMQKYEISSKLFEENLNSRTDISSMILFGERQMLLYRSIYSFWSVVRDYSKEEWYKKAIESETGAVVTGPVSHAFLLDGSEHAISVSRKISSYEDGSLLGVMLIDLNLNRIEEICSTFYSDNDSRLCLLNEAGKLVYEQNKGEKEYDLSNKDIRESLYQGIVKNQGQEWEWVVKGKEYQVVTTNIEKTGWIAVSLTPMREIKHSMYENMVVFIVVATVLLCLIIGILNILLGQIVKPITGLADMMDQADTHTLDLRVPVDSQDETGRLTRNFNKMLERIQGLMNQVVKEQEEKRKYELQMLQAQINPHFLYNTLDSIIWMAEMHEDNVVPMTEALARLFRISLNRGNEFITIEDELEHVRNYLMIQSMRYEDKIAFHILCPKELSSFQTIKLIIQPIVENSIYHGIKKKKGKGDIVITVGSQGEDILIKVMDNGVGMEKKLCEEILTKDSRFVNTVGSGTGVKNVNERIRLYFGVKYGLHYESELGKGTTVTIRVPKVMEEKK